VGKYEKRLRIQKESLDKFEKTVVDSKIKGDLLYSHYQEVESVLEIILQAREKYSWLEINKIIKDARKKKVKGTEIVESIDKLGNITLNLEGQQIILDSHLSIPENAETYYNKGKKAKRKIKGVHIAIEKTMKEIEKAESKRDVALEQIKNP